MDIQSVKLVCFSPTGTTRSILEGVARGLSAASTTSFDLTRPDMRSQPVPIANGELLIVGVPVYSGRVPALAREALQSIQGRGNPVVCIVVYGNRAYEDALLELTDIMKERGCTIIAGGAYIGEHSFSSSDTPIAVGRPDGEDLQHAERFGAMVAAKIGDLPVKGPGAALTVPGNRPYRDPTPKLTVDFITVSDTCNECGTCAEACPVEAIDLERGIACDREKCILCCACIKTCPEEARAIQPDRFKELALRLSTTCDQRQEPALFL